MLLRFLVAVLALSFLCFVEADRNLSNSEPHVLKFDNAGHVERQTWSSNHKATSDESEDVVSTVTSAVYHKMFEGALDKTSRQGVTYRDPKKLSRSDSCKYCLSSKCQSLNKISWRNTYCQGIKGRLSAIRAKDIASRGKKRSGYSHALMMTCFQSYCKTFRAHEFCGLKPTGTNVRTADLEAQLKREEAELKELTKRFRREAVPRFKHPDYMKRREAVLKHREDAKKTRNLAINARRDNVRMKKELQSTRYRKNVFDMHKWGNETAVYARYQSYWNRLNESLFFAVQTSPLSVEKVNKDVKKEYSEMIRERALVRKIRSAVLSMEEKHRLFVEQKELLKERVAGLEQSVAAAEHDVKLFRKVGAEVRDVLLRIIKDVKSGKITVGCGPDALANAIADYTT